MTSPKGGGGGHHASSLALVPVDATRSTVPAPETEIPEAPSTKMFNSPKELVVIGSLPTIPFLSM